jgi:hypothetical protein
MVPADQNFDLDVGQAATVRITMAPPLNVTGFTTRFRMRANSGGNPVIEKTTASGVTIHDSTDGVFYIALAAADMSPIPPGDYRWSFWRTDSGSESPIAGGIIHVKLSAETG